MSYGDSLYGTVPYGSAASAGDGTIEIHKPDLLAYLPEYYRRPSGTMAALQDAAGEEIGLLRYSIDDVLAQFFVSTASWGLDRWERELGMITDPSKPDIRRKEQINAKLRGYGTVTRQMMINTASAFSGGEVDVEEHPEEYRFVIKFVGVMGIPPNMAGFIQMLDQIKPAHLSYSFEYTYQLWGDIATMTWAEASTKTWGQLKSGG